MPGDTGWATPIHKFKAEVFQSPQISEYHHDLQLGNPKLWGFVSCTKLFKTYYVKLPSWHKVSLKHNIILYLNVGSSLKICMCTYSQVWKCLTVEYLLYSALWGWVLHCKIRNPVEFYRLKNGFSSNLFCTPCVSNLQELRWLCTGDQASCSVRTQQLARLHGSPWWNKCGQPSADWESELPSGDLGFESVLAVLSLWVVRILWEWPLCPSMKAFMSWSQQPLWCSRCLPWCISASFLWMLLSVSAGILLSPCLCSFS